MKQILSILFISTFLFSGNAQTFQSNVPEEYGYAVKLGQTVPNITLTLPDGSQTTMEKLRGKVVMLQFTASWCGVCRKEMPHIEKKFGKSIKRIRALPYTVLI